MWIDPAYQQTLARCGLDQVDKVLRRTDGDVVAWSRTTDSVYIAPPDGGVGFYIKRYTYPTWKKRLRGTFRGTFFGVHRGKKEHRALLLMRALGIPAVRPVAYGCRRVGNFLSASFLITEEVPGAPNLTTYAQRVTRGEVELSHRQRDALVRKLAEQIAAMHASNFAHGRPFWRNLLVREAPHGEPEFFLLDPEPPKRVERVGRGGDWWTRELAQLTTSAMPFTTRTERLRFMRHYLKLPRLTAEAKIQTREIGRLSEKWSKHEAQRVRMNARFELWTRMLADETAREVEQGRTADAEEVA